jgi:2'-5' RNA ligase
VSRIRTFLAVNFPVAVTRRIADEITSIQGEIANAGWKVAWVPAANLHVTLKFFGMVEEASIEGMHGRLARELAGRPTFEIEARGLGAFPGPLSARVLWAGVKPSPALAALQQDVEKWMEETGYPREPKPFHPHVTIGRVKEAGSQPIGPILEAREATVFGGGRVNEVVIYESRTMRNGSEYRALERASFNRSVGEAARANERQP